MATESADIAKKCTEIVKIFEGMPHAQIMQAIQRLNYLYFGKPRSAVSTVSLPERRKRAQDKPIPKGNSLPNTRLQKRTPPSAVNREWRESGEYIQFKELQSRSTRSPKEQYVRVREAALAKLTSIRSAHEQSQTPGTDNSVVNQADVNAGIALGANAPFVPAKGTEQAPITLTATSKEWSVAPFTSYSGVTKVINSAAKPADPIVTLPAAKPAVSTVTKSAAKPAAPMATISAAKPAAHDHSSGTQSPVRLPKKADVAR